MFLTISAVYSYTRTDVHIYSVLYRQNIWVTEELLQALEQQLPVTTQLKHKEQQILPQQSTARKKITQPALPSWIIIYQPQDTLVFLHQHKLGQPFPKYTQETVSFFNRTSQESNILF